MAHAEFVHLHLHTEYSLLDGACRLDRLVEKAHALKFSHLAITDHGVLYGAIDFYKAAMEKGIVPIIGCEVYVAPGSRLEKKVPGGGRDVYHHLVLLAKDETGYKNLVRLVTAAHTDGFYYKPRIDKELLAKHRDGLIALSGCLASEIPTLIIDGQAARARDAIDWFKQTLGADNFYLELQNNQISEQDRVNRTLIPWAREFGLKLVATNDVHYVERAHSKAHDCLVCIGRQINVTDPKPRYVPDQFYLRSAEEMQALFIETPEAARNTLEIAAKCNLELSVDGKKLHYPVFHPPEHFTRDGFLRKLIADGLGRRYSLHVRTLGAEFIPEAIEEATRLPRFRAEQRGQIFNDLADPLVEAAVKEVLDRVKLELGVIEKMGFVSYFLIVADFVAKGREMGVDCVARGSAAGSLVTYLLGIANVDPIRYGLLFERFLNPERVNPPDIDIDFADDRRADVIAYVREKYGRDCVAQIITFGTLGAKSVLRDVGRVMGLSYGECDRLAKMITDTKMDLKKALEQSPEFKAAYTTEERTRELVDIGFVLEDVARNASVHAAGVVIGGEPLVNLLPLKQEDDGTIVTQYAMGPVGHLGLLKMDLLGLKTLTVIRNCCKMVRETKGIEVDVDELPLDDAATYDLLNKANTLGVFQLESGGMRDLCRKFQISSIEHITALIALYRPGPMDLIPDFLKRRNGEVPIEYEHPLLEPIARETYGVLVYQEQVMQATQVLAGYTLGAADSFRRAISKKDKAAAEIQREPFVKGCQKTLNLPVAKANHIFDVLVKFAGYGFNKSHAAAYAIVAYQTAFLKAHHPVAYLCAMMTNDMGDTKKLGEFIAESRTMGVDVLPPDVNESVVMFAPAASVVARASRPCDSGQKLTGGTPVPQSPVAQPFIPFDPSRPASIHARSLPHWHEDGATYFITFRLADSLPKEVFDRWRNERDEALSLAAADPKLSNEEKAEQAGQIEEGYREKLDVHLDQGLGSCSLRDREVSAIVERALKHFDGGRYLLGSYVVMPNHVHALVRPVMEHKLPDILHAWKSFTAKEANKVLGRTGEYWQAESFDHIVRNEAHLEKFARYIQDNPVKAGLAEGHFLLGGGTAAAGASGTDASGRELTGGTPVPLSQHAIRFGLAAIKGIGEVAVQSILKARDDGGRFPSLANLCERVDNRTVNRKVLEALIKSGACDGFGETRATLFVQVDRTLARAASLASDRARGQNSLFGMMQDREPAMPQNMTKLPEWPQHELLAAEKELLGFYVTGHPLTPWAPVLQKVVLHTSVTIGQLDHRAMTRIGGLVTGVQRAISRKSNKPYLKAAIEDLDGSTPVFLINEGYEKFQQLFEPNKPVLVLGEVNKGDKELTMYPTEVLPLADAPKRFTKQVHLRLNTAHLTTALMEKIRAIAEAHRGACPLFLCLKRAGGEIVFIEANDRFNVMPSRELQQVFDDLLGEDTYYAKVDTTPPERPVRKWERRAEWNGEE